MGARRLVSTVLVSLCATVCGLVFGGVPALAGRGWAASSFSPPGGFAAPVGLAVDHSGPLLYKGDVYVADQGHDLLDRFSAAGGFLGEVQLPGTTPKQIAVDDYPGLTEGDVYVAGYGSGVVYRLGPELAFEGEVIKGLVEPTGVAVDQAGDIFVTEDGAGAGGAGEVLEFNTAGEPVDAAGAPSPDNAVVAGLNIPQTLAVDASGADLYVATSSGAIEYTLSGGVYEPAGGPSLDGASSNGVVIAPSGDLFVDQGNEVAEYEAAGGAPLSTFGAGVLSGAAYGVGVSEAGLAYVADDGTDLAYMFEEGPTPEVPATEPAVVKGAAVTLHGTLKPAGSKLSYYFLYNTGGSCTGGGRTTSMQGEGAVSAEISLQPQTQYTTCLVAENKYGPSDPGNAEPFATLTAAPSIEGESVSSITTSEAVLSAQVNPESPATSCEFQYVDETSFVHAGYAEATPLPCPAVLEGFHGQSVSVSVTGLQPGTNYHYRVVASNAVGEETAGPDETFATPEAPLTEPAVARGATEASLAGELNPHGANGKVTYQFDYNTNGTCAGGQSTSPAEAAEGKQVHVQGEAQGLEPNTRYTFCLVATNASGGQAQGNEVSLQTAQEAPMVGEESFSDVGSGSAALVAKLNAEKTLSSYYFQWGTSSEYGSQTPVQSLGAGGALVEAPAQLSGLQSSTEYHFRVVVTNTNGERTEGKDVSFKTLPTEILGLPDGRVYERVTPVNSNANVYVPEALGYSLPFSEGTFTKHPFEAATDGNAVAYVADPTSGGTGQGGQGSGNEYLATRAPTGGWTQSNIQPAGRYYSRYVGFSGDLSVGILQDTAEAGLENGLPPLSTEVPTGGYQDLYTHANDGGSYQPVFTKTATLHRTGAILGEEIFVNYAGSSTDLSQVFFDADDALTTDAVDGGQGVDNLYDSVDGRLSLVNVLPDGATEPGAIFGALPLNEKQNIKERQSNPYDLSHVVSTDGSRVFWTDLNTGALFVRENPSQPQSPLDLQGNCTVPGDACTLQVAAGPARFWTATPSGSEVFFTKGDLYGYDVESGQTTDLTPGVEVQGVIGSSENGEYVYYVDSADNLNLWHAGASTFIATLSGSDGGGVAPYAAEAAPRGDWQAGLGVRTAEATPDGRGLVFMSNQKLKTEGFPNGYPNEGYEEVYVYEAEGGHLFCASCSSSGEPPPSGRYSTAAFLPISWNETYLPTWISDDGSRVFFDSGEPLVPQDTNGRLDVYEWERDGTGSCHEGDGCIYLLSGGTSGSASWLLGASASGDDVFVISRAELVAGEPYDSFAVYDARVGGVQQLAAPACSGTGCQGVPPGPPIFATPASVTFEGVGNFPAAATQATAGTGKAKTKGKPSTRARKLAQALKACEKRRKDARAACDKQARKRYGAKSKVKKSAKKGGR
jgi:hypothetical protein